MPATRRTRSGNRDGGPYHHKDVERASLPEGAVDETATGLSQPESPTPIPTPFPPLLKPHPSLPLAKLHAQDPFSLKNASPQPRRSPGTKKAYAREPCLFPRFPTASPPKTKKGSPSKKTSNSAHSEVTDALDPSEQSTPSASLLSLAQNTTNNFHRQPRTLHQYNHYVGSGKAWLQEFVSISEPVMQQEDGEAVAGGVLDRKTLSGAFETLTDRTAIALRMFVSQKCEREGRGYSTAEAVRAAFKYHFEREMGCQGSIWKLNRNTGDWEGNPVFDPDYMAYHEALKRRHLQESPPKKAIAILPADMKRMLDYLCSPDAAELFTTTKRLFFSAFATTAFALWTRCDELIHLPAENMTLHALENKQPYFAFDLVFRKTNHDGSQAHTLQVPPCPEMPELDTYAHMRHWVQHLEAEMGRKLQDGDFIFPAIASTGKLKIGEYMPYSSIDKMLTDIGIASQAMRGRRKFTTHSFRRGGAQYRFMWAPKKWALTAVKWWGGWSDRDDNSTVMRYLLDELSDYEHNYADMLMDDRLSDRQQTFMGEKGLLTSTPDDVLREKLASALKDYPDPDRTPPALSLPSQCTSASDAANSCTSTPRPQALTACPGHAHASNFPELTSSSLCDAGEAAEVLKSILVDRHALDNKIKNILSILEQQAPGPTAQSSPSIHPMALEGQMTSPTPSSEPITAADAAGGRIPVTHTLNDVIEFWERGSPIHNLTPLMDWKSKFNKKQYSAEAVKYSNISSVYAEYKVKYSGSREKFDAAYPGLASRYKDLMLKIREAKIARGDAMGRKRKAKKA
ncbi:hypothetical protein BV25DRAFT_1917898 [Artomyces pyxidatus]|uniref:Uncharacterized protein n=1 Tax=Artomyces pyxidatus TaxID=48021 RepID=A0ACB8SVT7_9AGAM|nr:hypothetical protein BV25DRAFT_1917898 [Artomyces pyxidatus]